MNKILLENNISKEELSFIAGKLIIQKLQNFISQRKIKESFLYFNNIKTKFNFSARETTKMYNIVLSGLYKYYDFYKQELKTILENLQTDINVKADIETFSLLIKIHGKNNNLKLVNEIYQTILQSNITLDVNILNALIYSKGRCFDFNGILETFEEYESKGIIPDIFSYNTALAACIKFKGNENSKQTFFTEKILNKMFNNRITWNRITYSIIINYFLNDGKKFDHILYPIFNDNKDLTNLQIAKIVRLEALDKGFLTCDLFTPFITKFSQLNLPSELASELGLFHTYKIKGNTIFYNTLIHYFISVGNIDVSLKLYSKLINDGLTPATATFDPIIKYYSVKKDLYNTLLWFNEMYKIIPNEIEQRCYLTVLNTCKACGDEENCNKVTLLMNSRSQKSTKKQ